jgi:hypothetical protein
VDADLRVDVYGDGRAAVAPAAHGRGDRPHGGAILNP